MLPGSNGATARELPPTEDTLIGLVLRPPRIVWSGAEICYPSFAKLDASGLEGKAGIVRVIVEHCFVAIVAQSLICALEAAARLNIDWGESLPVTGPLPDQVLWERGAREPAASTSRNDQREYRYRWPVSEHRGSGRGWAVAEYGRELLTVWTNGESSPQLLQELTNWIERPALILTGIEEQAVPTVEIFDAAADAAFLSRVMGCPVRVASYETPILPADQYLTSHVRASFGADGQLCGYELHSNEYPWSLPSIGRLLARGSTREARPEALFPYAVSHATLTTPHEMRVSDRQIESDVLAGHVFANESFIDEVAHQAQRDPVDFRLARLKSARGVALLRSTCERAGWSVPLPKPGTDKRVGRGIAYVQVVDEESLPRQKVWSVWIAEVAVDVRGTVDVTRVVVGHDVEHLRDGAVEMLWVESQIKRQTQNLLRGPTFDDWHDASGAVLGPLPSGGPVVDLMDPGGKLAVTGGIPWNRTVMLPAAAALANAVFDATGVRLREPPFRAPAERLPWADQQAELGRSKRAAAWFAGIIGTAVCLAVTALPWRVALAPVGQIDTSLYSSAAVERGRLVASVGACGVCHTATEGPAYAGGLGLDTPFGIVYSTNITPDVETGIGGWSFAAFERAMREGIHRDGHHLYPAFPYTSFSMMSDGDMQALYAFLMTQRAVPHRPPQTQLAFPFNLRWLIAGWNLLFFDHRLYQPDLSKTAQWNRGRYLIDGVGHCGECHTSRNALGAERSGAEHYLSGGLAEGWEAPALNARSHAPLPWTEADFYQFLRRGFSPRHGVAVGPMGPVIAELDALPDSDIRAIANYLSSLADANATAPSPVEQEGLTLPQVHLSGGQGERIFQGACAACHEVGQGPTMFGSKPSLALNTNLHSDRADNLIQVILQGVLNPAHGDLGYMPGFADSLSDMQIAELANYMRLRFAPGKPAWTELTQTLQRIRRRHAEPRK